jgi:peptide/nickel transport system substrate-binding protein
MGWQKTKTCRAALLAFALWMGAAHALPARAQATSEELLTTASEPGQRGGRLTVALRAEPKTLNPITAVDGPSREVIGRMIADLIHINRASQQSEPALAKSWKVSPDGRRYTVQLRRGLKFSDGQPFDADDVVFSFQVYLDEKLNSPQRDLLVVGGKPIKVSRTGPYTVEFELAQPYAAAERLFDSVAIVPRHLLETDYRAGKLVQTWGLTSAPSTVAGLGPFRVKEYVAGQRVVLERNPFYWKADQRKTRLPYLDEIVFLFVSSDDAQVLRFTAGETDIISRVSPDNFAVLERDQQSHGFHMYDLGPGLEFNFLFFNLNSVLPKNSVELEKKQKWFQQVAFRQAISEAIDRQGINKLVYRGRGSVLATHVTPAYKQWVNAGVPLPVRSPAHARDLLRQIGFKWGADGRLTDPSGTPVEFSIATSASNAQRTQMATIIQDDLKELGIAANVVPLDFRSLVDRVFQSHDYEAAVLALGSGDVDPNPQMNVWLSNGSSHLWHLGEAQPATPWEAEIDRLMNQQLVTVDVKTRKQLYDRMQEIVARELPLICLVSPHILVGAKTRIGNFQPAILDHYTLWNADVLFLRAGR